MLKLPMISSLPTAIFLVISGICFLTNCNKSSSPDSMPDITGILYADTQFVMGADLSYVNAILDAGGVYRDSSGKIKSPYQIFRELGTNVVRVRKWHTPSWQNNLYGTIKYHEKKDVEHTIRESKKNKMKILLDLHYSDNWADPHKQETPKAWQGLALPVLADSLYRYTLQYLEYLESKDLVPEYIQIGNENNGGICYPVGKINSGNFVNFCTLVSAGCRAVRDFSVHSSIKPKILIHVAQFQDAKWWINGVLASGVPLDFDILGISHYYKWSTVNDPAKIKLALQELTQITKKDVWVVETAFPWTTKNKDGYPNILSEEGIPQGYSTTPEGQNKYLQDLTQIIIDGGGKGLIYWEPAWVSSPLRDQWNTGSAWDNATYFDFSNRVHPALKFMTHKYSF